MFLICQDMFFMYLSKNVWCCIVTNDAYVVYYIFLTEDATICGETRLRLTLEKWIKVVGDFAHLT
jgi:hypothetical protein